jgi:phosphatidylserine/phosphatidylglycerophosphate/cardiolipin synthase-like enzyme
MAFVTNKNGSFSVKAYRGDAKTLLAFNLSKPDAKNLAGFTIQCTPKGQQSYFLFNEMQYETPADHAQVSSENPRASINAPIFKFRWVHVPGSVHQGLDPFFGDYTYTVTPRYLKSGSLQPLDASLSVAVTLPVEPFAKGNLELGFTRGYTQSQAFDNHFGKDALIQPNPPKFMFNTSVQSGKNAKGETFTYQQEYQWLGFTAREKVFALLNDVLKDASSAVDVFAYNLDEPDVLKILLQLAKQNRIRIVLDDSKDNHSDTKPTAEDQFEKVFNQGGGKNLMQRGKFNRYAHDKVVIVYSDHARKQPVKVLTGATNFSVTGMYVNSNHVLIYNDPQVAGFYAGVFNEVWTTHISEAQFVASQWSNKTFSSTAAGTPKTSITFAPHSQTMTSSVLKTITDRIAAESAKTKTEGSVLFAVMQIDTKPPKTAAKGPAKGNAKSKKKPASGAGNNPVYTVLNALHKNDKIFSYGISDSPDGISLFPVGQKTGVLVTGKPINTVLPPPFNQVRVISGFGHQVHHKFVVCGFNDPDATVFCGSSNLSNGGENSNGDNLLEIQDTDIATVFAIEAVALVDHFDFLDRSAKGKAPKGAKTPAKTGKKGKTKKAAADADAANADLANTPAPQSKHQAAMDAHMFLPTDDSWTTKYFDPKDLHSVDRQLFGG